MRRSIWTLCALVSATAGYGQSTPNLFSPDEERAIATYWTAPGRYTEGTPDNFRKVGLWQVRLTVEGSTWIWSYYRKRGFSKVNPSVDLKPQTPEQQVWDTWIDAKVAWDRFNAGEAARAKNQDAVGQALPTTDSVAVADPGPAPESLVAYVGVEPPQFANAVMPSQHRINFDDGKIITYIDNPFMRPKYAYYRFAQGVQSGGTATKNIPDTELTALFEKAKVNQSIMRVMRAVSLLEGGFDSVNTYDTGFVSVGVIQFASLKAGAGSLGEVMRHMKTSFPTEFDAEFRKYGLDVTDRGALVAYDLKNRREVQGPEANQVIIDDKRLIAVFQRAGQVSEPFKICQIQVAVRRFYPANDVLTVKTADGQTATVKIFEVVRSEAGMATLMDRKVNTGGLGAINEVANNLMLQYGLTDPLNLANFEAQLVERMRYRKDYLADNTLSRPRDTAPLSNRSTDRDGRRKPGDKPRRR